MKRIVEEQRLGFVATVGPDGAPSLSPKGSFAVLDDTTLAFGDIRSPGTVGNLAAEPRVEVNFVDPFSRRGYRFAGTAAVVRRGEAGFDNLLERLKSSLAARVRAVVVITVTRAAPLTSPAYDDGQSEDQLRRTWTARFRAQQPGGRFDESA
jgi:predicted pyridoxine 5'-phosphate oxidase superfamily flavin-nucleotide-binding protein